MVCFVNTEPDGRDDESLGAADGRAGRLTLTPGLKVKVAKWANICMCGNCSRIGDVLNDYQSSREHLIKHFVFFFVE